MTEVITRDGTYRCSRRADMVRVAAPNGRDYLVYDDGIIYRCGPRSGYLTVATAPRLIEQLRHAVHVFLS